MVVTDCASSKRSQLLAHRTPLLSRTRTILLAGNEVAKQVFNDLQMYQSFYADRFRIVLC